MKAEYYNSPEDVIFLDPLIRFLSRLFGSTHFVKRCKICNKIPTELYGNRCSAHIKK